MTGSCASLTAQIAICSMGGKGSGRGSGGARPGAGRPRTYKRIQVDDEAAQQFGELLARWQAKTPEANWTASKLLSYLITGQYVREQIADGGQE